MLGGTIGKGFEDEYLDTGYNILSCFSYLSPTLILHSHLWYMFLALPRSVLVNLSHSHYSRLSFRYQQQAVWTASKVPLVRLRLRFGCHALFLLVGPKAGQKPS